MNFNKGLLGVCYGVEFLLNFVIYKIFFLNDIQFSFLFRGYKSVYKSYVEKKVIESVKILYRI